MSRRVDIDYLPYDEYSNRQLAAVPLAVLAVALLVVVAAYILTGTPVDLGLAFTGGTEIELSADASASDVRGTFEGAGLGIDSIRSARTVGASGDSSYIIETQAADADPYRQAAEEAGYTIERIEVRSATFGSDSQRQALIALVVAFLGMSVLVALMFRSLVPSLAIVASAFSDIVIPLALMNVFNIQLTLGTVAALLMIIGYSVDSDILLNNHVLRRHGDFYESAGRAMRTGVSMTVTSIAAMAVMAVVARLLGIPLLPDVGLVLVLGLSADLLNTYMLNMSLLRWYKYEGIAR